MISRPLDRETYEAESDRLNEEIALAEIGERDARIEELDVQAALNFGESLLMNAPRLWVEASLEQKQRLQQVFSRKEWSLKTVLIEPLKLVWFSMS